MTKIATLKMQAKNLRIGLATQEINLTASQALEAVAQQYGFSNWDTLAAQFKKKPAAPVAPKLKDMPLHPESIWMQTAVRTHLYNIGWYDVEGIALLEDESALSEYLGYAVDSGIALTRTTGLDSPAIVLEGDGHDVTISFRELQGIRYCPDLERGTWVLNDETTFMRFNAGGLWAPALTAKPDKFEVTVPEMMKSAKGCQLVVLPSGDGSGWDRHVIVPPHLKAAEISEKISAEITRLKALDEATPDEDGYTDEDLAAFVGKLGCLWVDEPVTTLDWD